MSCVSQKSDQNRAQIVCQPVNLVYADLNVFVHTTTTWSDESYDDHLPITFSIVL